MLESAVKILGLKCLRHLPWVVKMLTNARGVAYVKRGGVYEQRAFGCGPNGTSDQLGWRELIITPDMVGRKVAQFVAFEFKQDLKSKPTKKQANFISEVKAAGGCGAVIFGPAPEPQIERALFMSSKGVKVCE
ncbi:MAG: hypothetical protein EKK48_12095 [Candidatus Melainabacteria bacterium]|nr:MAG: hypothetical protein EKK48_12095 [Candidatus Melainabacteria bacterium]